MKRLLIALLAVCLLVGASPPVVQVMPTIDARGFAATPGTTTAGIQEAIDALPAQGGTVFVPSGIYIITSTIYTPCDRPCNLIGEGAGVDTLKGTVIIKADTTDIIRLRGDNSSIVGIQVNGRGSATAPREEAGRGIVIGRRAMVDPHPFPGATPGQTEVQNGGGQVLKNVLVEDVRVRNTSGWNLFIGGNGNLSVGGTPESNATNGVTLSIYVTLRRVHLSTPSKYGCFFAGNGNTTMHFQDGSMTGANNNAGRAGAAAYYAYFPAGEKFLFDHTNFEGLCPGTNNWIFTAADGVTFRDCTFEEDAGDNSVGNPGYFISVGGGAKGLTVRDCWFGRDGTTVAYKGMLRLIKFQPAVRGYLIANLHAQTSSDPFPAGTWVEQNHVDLGGDGNVWGVVVGPGEIVNVSGGGTVNLPIQYANVPVDCQIVGRQAKVPSLTGAKRDSTQNFPPQDGQIIYRSDGAHAGLQVYYGGAWHYYTPTGTD